MSNLQIEFHYFQKSLNSYLLYFRFKNFMTDIIFFYVCFTIIIYSYKKHKRTIADCRAKCKDKAEIAGMLYPYDVEDLQFYDKKIKESLCLMNCKPVAKMLRSKKRNRLIPIDVENKYIGRRPYEYLHMCYYKVLQGVEIELIRFWIFYYFFFLFFLQKFSIFNFINNELACRRSAIRMRRMQFSHFSSSTKRMSVA